jgi:solute carrier family 25 2-oxodicarboxylate transporter 21
VVKVRLQAREHLGRYANSFDCVRQLLRDEGVKAFTTGLGPTCWRNCVWNTVYFGLMHGIKDSLPKPKSKMGDLGMTLIAGTVGGMVATCFNAPFDVVKSRFQRQLPPALNNGIAPKYRYTLSSLATIYHEEGARALYKGFAPKCWRMGLGGGVTMVTFEAALHIMQSMNSSKR